MKKSWVLLLLFSLVINIKAQTWVQQSSGTTENLRDVFFIDANTGWVVGENGSILKTTNGGKDWATQKVVKFAYFIGCYFVNSNLGWASGDGGLYKTTDGGSSWNIQNGPSGLTKVYFNDQNNGWTVGGTDGSTPYVGDIFRTTDGGNSWSHQTNNTSWARFYGVQFVDANTGWAYAEVNNTVVKTTNGGADWQIQMSYGDSFNIQSMYFIDNNTGWIGGNDGKTGSLMKTTDGGNNWTNKTPNLQYGLGYIKFFDSKNGMAAGQGRDGSLAIISTTDGGENWSIQPTTFPNGVAGNGLEAGFFLNKNTGWAVGDNGIILKYSSTTGIKDKSSNVPLEFGLSQNYPNPFNPTTVINYTLPKASMVSIKIYDLLGKEVASLVNESKGAGNYSVQFSAENYHLTSGIYMYQLKADDFISMKKMVLMK